ncbi:MAG: tetratricopeptide repeat protein [Prevotella sp.]|jgi:tetratricopeptide (TPR) repeat protein
MKKFLFILSLIIVCGCQRTPQASPSLLEVERYVESQPYRAFVVLDSLDATGLLFTAADSALYTLLYQEALDKENLNTVSDSAIVASADYFERHGDRKHYAQAVYLQGKGHVGAMKGMKLLKQAERLATEQDDLYLLYKVHVALGQANGEWGCNELSIEHWKSALQVAQKIGGQERYAETMMQLGRAYGRMGDTARYYLYIQRSIPLISSRDMKAQALSALAEYYYQRGDTAKSMSYAKKVAETGLVYRAARIIGDVEWSRGNFEGAVSYYFQAIEADEFETRVHALKQLVEYFNRAKNNQRANFYFKELVRQYEWRQSLNPVQLTMAQNDIDREWRQSQTRSLIGRIAVGVAVLVVVFLVFIYWQKHRNKRLKKELEQLNSRYNADLQHYRDVNEELDQLRSRGDAQRTLLAAKEQEVEELQRRIAEYQEDAVSPKGWKDDQELLNSELVFRFHSLAAKGQRVDDSYWQQLNVLFDERLPHFLPTINARNGLTQREQAVCELIRLRFIPSEIAVLLLTTPQVISNLRAHLLQKIFGEKGGAKQFDERIRAIEA